MRRFVAAIALLFAICAYFTAHSRMTICSPWRNRVLIIHDKNERKCLELFLAGIRCAPAMHGFEEKLRRSNPAELFPAAYGLQAYYGDDDNVDPLQMSALSGKQAMNVAATVAMIPVAYFRTDGGDNFTFRDDTPNLGQQGVCCGEHRRDEMSVAMCTGFLIAPDTVLTARHCVDQRVKASKLRYVLGFVKDQEGHAPRTFRRNVTLFESFMPRISCKDDRGIDWAIVKLKQRVPDGVTPVELGDGKPGIGAAVYMVSSPLGVPLKIADHANVRSNATAFFVANLDGFTSSSGAPVFSQASHKLEGIYVRGEVDTRPSCGCARASICPNNGCRGEDVTRISIVPKSIDAPLTDCEGELDED